MSSQSLTISSFTLSTVIFEEGTCQQLASFPQVTLSLWNLNKKIEARQLSASFQIVWYIEMPKWMLLPQLQNYYQLYILKNEILKASIFYQHKIIYQHIFLKINFIHLKFFPGLRLNYCIFSKIWSVLRHQHMSSE